MIVLEELDNAKKGLTEVSRNVRQVSRFIGELMENGADLSAGPGTKMVCLGNVEQIDTPYLTETTSGLTFAVDRFKTWQHSGHITLRTGERSRLAHYASENL